MDEYNIVSKKKKEKKRKKKKKDEYNVIDRLL